MRYQHVRNMRYHNTTAITHCNLLNHKRQAQLPPPVQSIVHILTVAATHSVLDASKVQVAPHVFGTIS
jgi:hypothetical protein